MTFLQPLLLFGLPLATIPIIIHLIHRQRYRTVEWGAMRFLLDAQRLSRGMARLRYYLIMAMRMLAIAALIVAISRPLAAGWLGLTIGGQPDSTLVLLDRSASMEQQSAAFGGSKRATGLEKLSEFLNTTGSGARLVLLENTTKTAREIDSIASLTKLPDTTATSTAADIPGLLEAALAHVVANQTGRTDIWICSDLRLADWNPDDGRWPTLREAFSRLDGVQFYLLSYPQTARDNTSVWVRNAQRRDVGTAAELTLDIHLKRETETAGPTTVPIEIIIDGARSVHKVEMTEADHVVQGHAIPLDAKTLGGWGRVEIPTDDNALDNTFYFAFSPPSVRRTVIVSENPASADAIEFAVTAPVDPALEYACTKATPDQVQQLDWSSVTLLIWHAPVPEGVEARLIQEHVASGRPVVFLPPEGSAGGSFHDVKWSEWENAEGDGTSAGSWRGDSDLLAHTGSGAALPVPDVRIFRHRAIEGKGTALARAADGKPLLLRTNAEGGSVYFLGTTPRSDHSNMAQNGVVLYVMLQRALSAGAATQGGARQLAAGEKGAQSAPSWTPLSESPDGVAAFDRSVQAGAFKDNERWVALNRPEAEDNPTTLDRSVVEGLFDGLNLQILEDRVDSAASLASETWRAFLIAMATALVAEACLCMPAPRREVAS